MTRGSSDFDVVIVGGGPAGSTLGSFLAMNGYRALIVERDIHPREHVGEALTPSTNVPLNMIGFIEKMEDADFVRKPGVVWTTPLSQPGKVVAVRTGEFPFPGAPRPYSYNVERGAMDAMLLRHASELGAKVLQGVSVRQVLFEDGRAVGVRASVTDGWERDLFAPVIVDATGRSCLIAKQLRLRRKDPELNQFSIWSWFRGVDPGPPGYEDFLSLHFLGLKKAWAWQIPLRNGVTSVGMVTDKEDFKKSGRSHEDFFNSLVSRSRTVSHYMRDAQRIRPWWIDGDFTYEIETVVGKGWLLVGDAMRFIDPVFSSGMDVATYSALFAFEAIDAVSKGENEERVFAGYQSKLKDGVDVWYELCRLFYGLQLLFTIYAAKRRYRETLVRVLQGNPYAPDTLERARELVAIMRDAHERVMSDPNNLLRPGALAVGGQTGPSLEPSPV